MIMWRKSSYSGTGSQNDCVELAQIPLVGELTVAVGVRDSKAPESGHLSLSVAAFGELVARVKRAELDL